jgi:hypothetical protein
MLINVQKASLDAKELKRRFLKTQKEKKNSVSQQQLEIDPADLE